MAVLYNFTSVRPVISPRIICAAASGTVAEPSPAGAKYAVSLLGLCSEECRLPVMPLSEATRERIRSAMQALNLL